MPPGSGGWPDSSRLPTRSTSRSAISKVVEIVNSTHFVTLQSPRTSATSSPEFTG